MSGGEGIRNPTDIQPILDVIGDFTDLDTLYDAVIVIDGIVDLILIDTTAIRAITDALPTLAETGGMVNTAVINTEYNVYVNLVPLGVFNPVCVKI
ncbi:unnamed protein product, partial [marine sediment metagenome]